MSRRSFEDALSENARIVRPAFLDKAQNQVREVQPRMVVDCARIRTANICTKALRLLSVSPLLTLHHSPSLYPLCPQKDLIRRLRKLTTVLQTDESIEANDSTEWPGVAALAQTCASLLRHKDKQVRLYSTLACMELFAIVS